MPMAKSRRVDTVSGYELEQRRLEINEALRYGHRAEPDPDRKAKLTTDFGPPWGFASLGSYYGQNRPGFVWPKRKR